MLCRKNFKISLAVPTELNVFKTSDHDNLASVLAGHVTYHNLPATGPQGNLTKVFLIRVGRLNHKTNDMEKHTSKHPLSFLRFKTQEDLRDFYAAEKVVEVVIDAAPGGDSSKCLNSSDFRLHIPPYLPSTTKTPSVEIYYAIVSRATLSNGEASFTGCPLQISRRSINPNRLHSSPLTTFPESTISMKVAFANQKHGQALIPAILQLGGLEVPAGANLPLVLGVSSVRDTEARYMMPREIRWEVDEITNVVHGHSSPPREDILSASSAEQSSNVRTISKGRIHPRLRCPFRRPENEGHSFDIQVPLDITIPDHIDLSCANELTLDGDRILHTIALANTPLMLNVTSGQKRFATCLEYRLRICVEMGEDTFHKATGSLVHRRPAHFVYTVSNLLKPALGTSREAEADLRLVPPTYDFAMGSSPR